MKGFLFAIGSLVLGLVLGGCSRNQPSSGVVLEGLERELPNYFALHVDSVEAAGTGLFMARVSLTPKEDLYHYVSGQAILALERAEKQGVPRVLLCHFSAERSSDGWTLGRLSFDKASEEWVLSAKPRRLFGKAPVLGSEEYFNALKLFSEEQERKRREEEIDREAQELKAAVQHLSEVHALLQVGRVFGGMAISGKRQEAVWVSVLESDQQAVSLQIAEQRNAEVRSHWLGLFKSEATAKVSDVLLSKDQGTAGLKVGEIFELFGTQHFSLELYSKPGQLLLVSGSTENSDLKIVLNLH